MTFRGISLVLAVALALLGSVRLTADSKDWEDACKRFGGSYEVTTEDGDKTYYCRFDDGWGRVCEQAGVCSTIDGASSVASSDVSAAPSDGESTASSGEYADKQECVQAERGTCQDQCSGKSRQEMGSCMSACLDDACGDYPTTSSADASSGSEEGSGQDCQSQCNSKCSEARGPMKRKCQQKCEQACKG